MTATYVFVAGGAHMKQVNKPVVIFLFKSFIYL